MQEGRHGSVFPLLVGRADSRYAKGTVALTVSIYRIYAAVRSFCPVTETERIGSIARELQIPFTQAETKACESSQGKSG